MATLNFPDSPDTGDIYFDSNSGFTYEWNGTVWISRGPSTVDNIKELDNISGSFNGSTTTFNLTSSSVAVSPATAQQLVINIGNVLQNPGDDYTVSGSTITFTTAPLAGYVFQGTVLGNAFSLGTVDDGTVSPSSFDTSDSYNIGGITVTGITTVKDFTISGIATVANLEPVDVNVSGIGTVSNIIMTKDAAGLGATMGAAVGVVTYYGDGSNLTGLGLTFFPISYDPGISSTGQPVDTNITLDWNHPVKAGSGTITIREGSESGTVIDQFVVGSSSSISFVNNQVILNPAENVGYDTSLYINFPAGSVKQYGDLYQNGQVTYSFDTRAIINQLWTWGNNEQGKLGVNSRTNYSSPVQVPGSWKSIGANQNIFAINTDDELFAWGWNDSVASGLLGLNDTVQRSSPTQIPGTWSRVHNIGLNGTNYYTSGAIKSDGTLWIWGTNNAGQLGLNDIIQRSSPCQLAAPSGNWDKVTLSQNAFGGIKDGELYLVGRGGGGGLGQNSRTYFSSPVQIPGTTWANLDIGDYGVDAFATKTNGTLWSWGYGSVNGNGSLGQNNNGVPYSSPTQIGTGTDWATGDGKLAAGNKNAGCIKTDGTLWVWGSNQYGMSGVNVGYNPALPDPGQPAGLSGFSSPVQIPGTTWDTLNIAGYSMWAQKTDGTQWAWGQGDSGNLAQNVAIDRSSPIQVTGFRATFTTNGSITGFSGGAAGFKGT